MPFLIGILLALACGGGARAVGLDRDRAFYPTLLVVVASYYVLFAILDGSTTVLLIELVLVAVFLVLTVAGFKASPWWLVAGFAAHGVLDMFHCHLVMNLGVPAWWPAFCGSFDIAAAIMLAVLLRLPLRRLQHAH